MPIEKCKTLSDSALTPHKYKWVKSKIISVVLFWYCGCRLSIRLITCGCRWKHVGRSMSLRRKFFSFTCLVPQFNMSPHWDFFSSLAQVQMCVNFFFSESIKFISKFIGACQPWWSPKRYTSQQSLFLSQIHLALRAKTSLRFLLQMSLQYPNFWRLFFGGFGARVQDGGTDKWQKI